MLRDTWQRFWQLTPEVRAMVGLFWVYEFGQSITAIFLSVYVVLVTQSALALIWYMFVFWIAVFVGYVLWGVLVAERQISMRLNYLKAFAIYFLSFITLLALPKGLSTMLIFAGLNGLGLGMFWLGVHTYEMLHTEDKIRDFYSSMTAMGCQVVTIIAPLLTTALLFVAEVVLELPTFSLLLWFLPLTYLAALPFVWSLSNYTPPRICWQHMHELAQSNKTKIFRVYSTFGGSEHAIEGVVMPLIALTVLQSAINIGIFETVVGVISIAVTLIMSQKRHAGNRIKLLWIGTTGISIALVLQFFYHVHPLFFFTASLIGIIVHPISGISRHVIDLQAVEQSQRVGSFYEALLFRDAMLFLGRLIMTLLLAIIFLLTTSEFFLLHAGLMLMLIVSWCFTLLAKPLLAKKAE